MLTRIWTTLDDDRQEKTRLIVRLEQDLAAQLVKTPYLLLLSHPGRGTPPDEILRDLRSAAGLIPRADQEDEARLLKKRYHRTRPSRRTGPEQIGRILIGVLARLGVNDLQSTPEAPSPDAKPTDSDPR